MIGMVVIKREANLLVVTEKGMGKCSPIDEYRVQKRGGKGIITVHRTDKTGDAVSIKEVLPDDELMLITKQGVAIRMPVKGIRVAGRNTQGVRLVNLEENDLVMDVARVVPDDDEEPARAPSTRPWLAVRTKSRRRPVVRRLQDSRRRGTTCSTPSCFPGYNSIHSLHDPILQNVITTTQQLVTLEEIRDAARVIAPVAVRTPVLAAEAVAEKAGAPVWIKPETLQRGGAFKFRGAYNFLSRLEPEARERGVVAPSSGNHAQAVALAAKLYGVPATVVMPVTVTPAKRSGAERLGARVVLAGRTTAGSARAGRGARRPRGAHARPAVRPSVDHRGAGHGRSRNRGRHAGRRHGARAGRRRRIQRRRFSRDQALAAQRARHRR